MNDVRAGLAYLNALCEWRGTKGFNLDKIAGVMRELGQPQDKPKSVHVTGTNGKGSVSAAIAAVLGASGASVGLNISPHLARLNERIVIDGFAASDEQLADSALKVKAASERLGVELSFHEGITAVAFICFEELEWVVIEVGLGGRLDASNVLTRPEAAVIVSVDLDHEHILGYTLRDIGREKAGIVKRGSVVVTGPLCDEALGEVRSACERQGAALFSYGRDFSSSPALGNTDPTYQFHSINWGGLPYSPSLSGRHQGINMAVVVAVAKALGLRDEWCRRGIHDVFWPARLEERQVAGRNVVLDCAHNPAGVKVLTEYLRERHLKDLALAFGVLQTKNWEAMVDLLIPFAKHWFVMRPDSHLAVEPSVVQAYLAAQGVKAEDYGSDYERFIREQVMEGQHENVLLAGSMYLTGKLRSLLVNDERPIWHRRAAERAHGHCDKEVGRGI